MKHLCSSLVYFCIVGSLNIGSIHLEKKPARPRALKRKEAHGFLSRFTVFRKRMDGTRNFGKEVGGRGGGASVLQVVICNLYFNVFLIKGFLNFRRNGRPRPPSVSSLISPLLCTTGIGSLPHSIRT